MKTPLQKVKLGALVLLAIFMVAVGVYHWRGDYSWLDAVWMVVITISSVGYGERSQIDDPGLKVFTILLIVFGISAAAYTVGGFIQILFEGELERVLEGRKMKREIEGLNDHVIICGFGRMGVMLASDLRAQGYPVVIIDNEAERIAEAKNNECLYFMGDATEEDVLLAAGIEAAKTVISVLPHDAENVFIALTCRELNPDVHIISRAEHASTKRKLLQAGADRVVMPAVIGAQQMTRLVTRPSTAELMHVVAGNEDLDVELDEVDVTANSALAGQTIGDSQIGQQFRLLVVGVKQLEGPIQFNPQASYVLRPDDVLIVLGRTEDIEQFRVA
ncbi:MAG: potassium channel protein [Pirellulaceae bacterium]